MADPELVQELREEVDAVVQAEGWTKAAIDKMRKLDSFIRESQRSSRLVPGKCVACLL